MTKITVVLMICALMRQRSCGDVVSFQSHKNMLPESRPVVLDEKDRGTCIAHEDQF